MTAAADDEDRVLHVRPVDDYIEHLCRGGDCICGPRLELVERWDGSVAELYVHHALDGRESYEAET